MMTPWPLQAAGMTPETMRAASFNPKGHVRRWKNCGATWESRNFHVGGASHWRPGCGWSCRTCLAGLSRNESHGGILAVPESQPHPKSQAYSNLWIEKRLNIFKNIPMGEKIQTVGPDWVNLTFGQWLDIPTLGERTTGKSYTPTPRLPLEHVGPLHVLLLGSDIPHEHIKSRILGRSHRWFLCDVAVAYAMILVPTQVLSEKRHNSCKAFWIDPLGQPI